MTGVSETTGGKQKPQLFKPGQSGNPAGRPKGARHKVTLAIEAILEGEAEGLTRKAVEMAKAGDITALRLCLDRLAPTRRDRPVTFDLPKIGTAADLPKATRAIMEAVAAGELTPSEAAELGKLVDAHATAITVTQLAERLNAIDGKGM